MWTPVAKIQDLTDKPLPVNYWGSRYVVFRTASGALGALKDACGHRGIPLSGGDVQGEAIRCPFHHFRFDKDGKCVGAPGFMQVTVDEKRACRVPALQVREAYGLIWLSSVPAEQAPFPTLDEPAAGGRIRTRIMEIEGDILGWMDHWFDVAHAFFPHAPSFFDGTADESSGDLPTQRLESIEISPCQTSGEMHMRGGLRSPALAVAQAGGVLRLAKRCFELWRQQGLGVVARRLLLRNVDNERVVLSGRVENPWCQRLKVAYRGIFGEATVNTLTFINSIAPNRHKIVFVVTVDTPLKGPFREALERWTVKRLCAMHVDKEDYRHLSVARDLDAADFVVTKFDGPAMTTRRRAFEFGRDFGAFFAKDSLIHGICRDPRLLPTSLRPRVGASAYARNEEIPVLPADFDRSRQPAKEFL